MSNLIFYDSAFPPASPPKADGVAFYIGGDTPHVWTEAEIAATNTRFRLPVYVRSNPPGPGAIPDVAAAVARLALLKAPRGTLVAWDMEMAADASYIKAVYGALNTAGYKLIVYGSQSTVLGNDNPDGLYWGAAWTGVVHIAGGDVMTQYVSFSGYDESEATSALPFWDTAPPAPVGPQRHVSTGLHSLAALARERNTTVQALINITLANVDAKNKAAFEGYLARDPTTVRMPIGLVYYTKNP